MSLAENQVLQRLVLQIKYREGIVYLDKCGSLMVSLQRLLGEPFKTSVPDMRYGTLTSPAERLVVRYGPDDVTCDQQWLETPARFDKVAASTWPEVARSLDVENKVTRCGLRAWVLWGAESTSEAQEALRREALILETEPWERVFGKPKSTSFSGVSTLSDGRDLRSALDAVEVVVEGRLFPDEEKFAPRYALQLDLDFSIAPAGGELSRAALLKFMRSSLSDLNRIVTNLNQVFHVESKSNRVIAE